MVNINLYGIFDGIAKEDPSSFPPGTGPESIPALEAGGFKYFRAPLYIFVLANDGGGAFYEVINPALSERRKPYDYLQ